MRWRTIEEVKAGKGDKICANVACGRADGLEEMEVAFGYEEEGKRTTRRNGGEVMSVVTIEEMGVKREMRREI